MAAAAGCIEITDKLSLHTLQETRLRGESHQEAFRIACSSVPPLAPTYSCADTIRYIRGLILSVEGFQCKCQLVELYPRRCCAGVSRKQYVVIFRPEYGREDVVETSPVWTVILNTVGTRPANYLQDPWAIITVVLDIRAARAGQERRMAKVRPQVWEPHDVRKAPAVGSDDK
eukprot:1778583-Pleurochrysis_carterae.AAC.3